jgi:competence protein ComEA
VEPCQVYVTGAVLRPGMVELTGPDPRVEDALAAAGGWADEADREAINLAHPIRDGDHIHVYWVEEGASRRGESVTERVNINNTDLASLMALPGIGETYAQRIIDYRETHGLF